MATVWVALAAEAVLLVAVASAAVKWVRRSPAGGLEEHERIA